MPLIETVDTVSAQDKELFKKVRKVHLSELLPNFNFPTGIEYAVVDENNNILNYCTEDYSLVRNSAIFQPIEKKLQAAGVDYKRQLSVVTNSRFYVTYLLKGNKEKALGQLYPKLTITNSYDSSAKFNYEFGWMRLVCLNGLTRPHGETITKLLKHGGLTEADMLFLIRDIMEHTEEFVNQSKKDLNTFERLNSKKVTKKLIQEVVKQAGLTDKIATAAEARFALETGESSSEFTYVDLDGNLKPAEKADKSLFTLYNAINHAIYNTNAKEPLEEKAKKDSKLLSLVEARLN